RLVVSESMGGEDRKDCSVLWDWLPHDLSMALRLFGTSPTEVQARAFGAGDDPVPFMIQVFQIRQEKRKLIPAVTHVDGSGRKRYPPLLIPDTTGSLRAFGPLRAYQWSSTHHSTRTSLWSAKHRKRWIAS